MRKPPDLVAAGVRWRKIEKAQTWRPGDGEVLQGTYVRAKELVGQYGPYTVHIVRTAECLYQVGGSVLHSLMCDAGVVAGNVVRVVYLGLKRSGTADRAYKDFELYVAVKADG